MAILAAAAGVAAGGTWLATWLFGSALERHGLWLALIVCALIVPAVVVVLGIVLFQVDSARYPQSDGPPMALAGTLMLAMLMPAVTIPVAWLGLRSQVRS